jgi:hypothetical protein
MLTDAEFTEIEQRCSKAQRGPWMVAITKISQLLIITHVETAVVASRDRLPPEPRQRLDEWPDLQDDFGYVKPGITTDVSKEMVQTMEFVAHSRNDVPKLLDEIRRLKEENAQLKRKISN